MPNYNKQKGDRFEREIVDWFRSNGVHAERVPLSGAVKGNYAADIRFGPTAGWRGECKRMKTGLTKIYDAMEQDDADVVFLRADRKQTIVAMSLDSLLKLMEDGGYCSRGWTT